LFSDFGYYLFAFVHVKHAGFIFLSSNGSSSFPVAVAGDRTVVLSTKFNVNHH
jgi:hypothetical protein